MPEDALRESPDAVKAKHREPKKKLDYPLRWGGFAKEDCIAARESVDSSPWLSISFIALFYGQPYNIRVCLYGVFRI